MSLPTPNQPPLVVLLDHHGGAADELGDALAAAGFRTAISRAVSESVRLLERETPDVVLLNPLVLRAGAVEVEMLEHLQSGGTPVPVILLVEDQAALQEARRLDLPFRDFATRPFSPLEMAHRVELALNARRRLRSFEEKIHNLESLVAVDFKTGLLSERHFRRLLNVEHQRAQRHRTPLALLLIDLDDFKRINDTTEYAFGDAVLRAVGQSIKQNLRAIDFAARLGGDEFVALLPNTSPAQAVQTAMRMRHRLAALEVERGAYATRFTCSMGIEGFDGQSEMTVEKLLSNANQALKEAKQRGKNQVWLYSRRMGEGSEPEHMGRPELPGSQQGPGGRRTPGGENSGGGEAAGGAEA